MGNALGKVVRTVAAFALAAVAIVATAGAAIPGVAAGLGLVGVSTAAFGLAASVALVGAQYLLSNRSQTQAGSNLPTFTTAPSGPAPTPLYRTVRQSEVPRSFIFGRTRTAGAFFFYESDTIAVTGAAPTTSTDARIGKYLWSGIYICDGPIDGFDAFLCDDEPFLAGSTGINQSAYTPDGDANVFIPLSGIKFVKSPNYTTSSTSNIYVYYPPPGYWTTVTNTSGGTYKINECALIAVEPVIGTEAGYNSYLLNTLMTSYRTDTANPTPMNGLWSTAHVGKGITCLYTYASTVAIPSGTSRIKYFPNGFPEWSAVVRGARMYDPRDPTHTLLDPTTGRWSLYNQTWDWSENPALIAGHFISWLIDQGVTAITGVDWDAIATAANDCDALKQTKSLYFGNGYEKFAIATGVFYFNTPPREFLSNLMATCDGSFGLDQQGRFTMWVGKWEDPEITFTENDIGGFTEEFVESATEAMNEVHITYIEPRQNYQKWEAPVWQDLGSQALVGRRVKSLDFQMVPSPNQAYRMAQRAARRINGKKKLTITVGPRGMLAIKQRVVGIDAPNFGLSGVWRVESLTPDMTLTRWQMSLREIDASVFADEPPPSDALSLLKVVNAGTVAAPTVFLLYAVSTAPRAGYVLITADLNKAQSGNATAQITEAALIQDQTLQFDARYTLDNGANWAAVNIELSANVLRTAELASGSVVGVQTRWVKLDGSVSAWSNTQTISIP